MTNLMRRRGLTQQTWRSIYQDPKQQWAKGNKRGCKLNFFYTQQLKQNSQIVLRLKLKYTCSLSHTIVTVTVDLPPCCATSFSPSFIFTVMWLLNLWFIASNHLFGGLAFRCRREYPYLPNCEVFFIYQLAREARKKIPLVPVKKVPYLLVSSKKDKE